MERQASMSAKSPKANSQVMNNEPQSTERKSRGHPPQLTALQSSTYFANGKHWIYEPGKELPQHTYHPHSPSAQGCTLLRALFPSCSEEMLPQRELYQLSQLARFRRHGMNDTQMSTQRLKPRTQQLSGTAAWPDHQC